MKRIALFLSAVLCLSVAFGQKKPVVIQKIQRSEILINSNWTFNYFASESADKGYESSGTNDSRWIVIGLPHTWSTYETTGELHPYIRNVSEKDNPYWWTGWGWYRKHFTLNKEFSDRKVFIEFEGVQKYCKVWLNGKYLGEHKGGYGSFDFDITQLIKPGGDNIIAVAVNNRQNDSFRIPPMEAGKFNVYGGIYRDVKIVLKSKLYIPMQGSALHEGGTFVTTPGLKEKEGNVRVQTWVKNDNSDKKSCTLQTTVLDASNRIVEVIRSTADINPGQLYKFDQLSKPLKNPHLWSNENPYLYRITSEVIDGKDLVDSYITFFGFRWIRWNLKNNILLVNGKKIIIHGGVLQSDYPWLGDAVPKWIIASDFRNITDVLNFNFLRTSDHPADKFLYELADKSGVIIEEASPNISDQDFSPEVQEQQMKEMIRRDRNHPSIIFWNLGNETNRAADSKYAIAEDTTRLIIARYVTGNSAGSFVRLTEKNMPVAEKFIPAVRGWYNNDVKDIAPSGNMETGTEEQQQEMMISGMKAGTDNSFSTVFADFGSSIKYLNSPLLYISPAGLYDPYRMPKYSCFMWQASLGKNPVVFIQPHFWRVRYVGQKRDITVNSNCDKVELKVNGVSKGILIPDETNSHCVVFKDILIEKGTLSAAGTYNGGTVTTQIIMAGEPAKIVLKSAVNRITAEKGSVMIITADIVDFNGNHVYGATNSVKWTVTGPATIVGPGNYETDINKHEESDGVWYIDMPVSNVLRSTGLPGKVHVTVSASGLASGSVDIDAEKINPDNSVITEPVLENEGRKIVTRLVLTPSRLDELPREINLTTEDLKFTSANKPAYIKLIRDYIFKNNKSVDSVTIEFRSLIDILATHLVNNYGILNADDYNFSVDHFNNSRLIAGYIAATKLPPLYKDGLRKYYANSIIILGNEKNAGDEMNWLNWIPSGGTVVIFNDGGKVPAVKGAVMTPKNELQDLIALVYPAFVNFSSEAKERALLFISKANPYIEITSGSEPNPVNDKEKITRFSYHAEKGQPILIPLLKFIQE